VSAADPIIDTAIVVKWALEGHPVRMLGRQTAPQTFLANLRHLATMILHLLTRPQASSVVDWAGDLHREASERTTQRRGPRWGISPPQSAPVRGHVLSEAHEILSATSIEEAGARLAPWLGLIADEGNGPRGWLLNRTTRTATIERLVDAAVANRHHVGRRLDHMHGERTLRTTAIPQLIDVDIYREFFDDMLDGYEWTGRLYVSLCVVRMATPTANWRDAAAHIGLNPDIGIHTARAANNRMRVSPTVFADAVQRSTRALPRDRDFRQRESRVRALAQEPTEWHDSWRRSVTPSRRQSSLPFAVTWMWCEVAQGSLDTSPAWGRRPTQASKVAYRAFHDKLPPPARESLRSLVLPRDSETRRPMPDHAS
jgi:hypothetical protein